MQLLITVDVKGQHWSGGQQMEIPELYRECFEPMKVSDEPLMAYITGDKIASSAVVRTVMQTRKDAAKILSEAIAKALVAKMQKCDTHNGYSKEELDYGRR